MSNIICFVMVVACYALGHAGGYRLCKLRIKNRLRQQVFSYHHTYPNKAVDPLETLSDLLLEVGRV